MEGQQYPHNLFKYNWLRIILDEANKISNKGNRTTQAVLQLSGMSKWVMTGTPIENSINDLFPFVAFLNYEPWNEKKMWDKMILKPLFVRKEIQALQTLNKIIRPIILRRTKKFRGGQLNLQKVENIEVMVTLSSEEMEKYNELAEESEKVIEEELVGEKQLQSRHIYETILRLRQLANHP